MSFSPTAPSILTAGVSPFTQLLTYRAGTLAFTGTCHGYAYQEDPAQLRLLYLACAEL